MRSHRSILHVDMDAFFASVEQLDNPQLKGKPVLVGYDGPRGVVAAASYESRVFGCRSAQPIGMARRLCPSAIVVPVRHGRYRDVSRQVFSIFERYTPMIEPLSLDEAFLDVTGSERLHGSGPEIANRIRSDIAKEVHLTASVGVAPNKFLAKLASDMNKPDGLTIVAPDKIESILESLPVSRMWGVGPKMAQTLAGLMVKTIGDLRRISFDALSRRVEARRRPNIFKSWPPGSTIARSSPIAKPKASARNRRSASMWTCRPRWPMFCSNKPSRWHGVFVVTGCGRRTSR